MTSPYCHPHEGSEAGVAWRFVKAAASRHNVCLITGEQWREAIEAVICERSDLNLTVYYLPWRREKIPKNEFVRQISFDWTNRHWNYEAYLLAKKLSESQHFDLTHKVGMAGFREPGFLWKLPLPFVLGPVSGFSQTPMGLMCLLSWKARGHQFARNVGVWLDGHFRKRVHRAMQHAAAVIAATSVDVAQIERHCGIKSRLLVHTGSPRKADHPSRRDDGDRLELICVTQLIPRKGVSLILEALATLSFDNWKFTLLGDGPLLSSLREYSEQLGIADQCRFCGRVSRDDALKILSLSHLFLWASVLDSNPSVLAEALSLGVPVISIDNPGYHELIGEDCGEVVPITGGRHDMAQRMGEAIEAMYLSEEFRLKKAHGALRRAKAFGLNSELLELDKIYAEVVDKTVLMDTSTC